MMGQTPGWWFRVETPEHGPVFACAPPKCGLMSFLAALTPGLPEAIAALDPGPMIGEVALGYARRTGLGPFSAAAVVTQFPTVPRVLAAREPVRRFRSLWKDKARRYDGAPPVLRLIQGFSPDELLDLIEVYPFGNAHWLPQYGYLVPDARVVSAFGPFFRYLGLAEVRVNATRRGVPPFDEERVRRLYDRDVALWERALR